MAPAALKIKKPVAYKKEEPVKQEIVMEEPHEQEQDEEEEQEEALAEGDDVEAAEEEAEEADEVEEQDEPEEAVEMEEEEAAEEDEEEAGDEPHTKPIEERLQEAGDAQNVGSATPPKSEGDAGTAAKDSSDFAADKTASSGSGKIFIGGLTWETTSEMLTNHFKKYGDITDSVIMKNKSTNHPRGFGFVTFADPSVLDKVLKDNHVIDGRTVDAKRTVPREKMSAASKGPKTKKIFVGGLTTATTDEEFKNYFAEFGKIVECQIMQDHNTGRSRGFGFVTFDNEQVVEDILAQGKMHELGGKQVEIKKAEPKRTIQETPSGYGGGSGGHLAGRSGGGGYNSNSGIFGAYNGDDTLYGVGGAGYYGTSGGRPGGYPYSAAYGYGAGYGSSYGYGDVDDGYGALGYNYAGYGTGSGYGYNYGGGYSGVSRGYGSGSNGRFHPYNR